MTPSKLEGKAFEELLLEAAAREEEHGNLTMSRYGVMSSFMNGAWRPVDSLPDFEGDRRGGLHFIFEAKVCSQSAFQFSKAMLKPKQVSHMLRRARVGVPCFLVIHFNERPTSAARAYPAITVAIPVLPDNPLWQAYVDAYAEAKRTKAKFPSQGSISRDRAQDLGCLVPWRTPKGYRKALPDLLSFLDPDAPRETRMETQTLL